MVVQVHWINWESHYTSKLKVLEWIGTQWALPRLGEIIFNEILDNNNVTKDEIYAFTSIGAYQQGKLPENKICVVTAGNYFNYLNFTSQLPQGHTPLSITGMKP